jgi:dTDP-4-amino-4,6-dideoxygalactose transaminase
METIPVFKPWIGVDTARAAVDALDLGWLGMGSYVKEFEESVARVLDLRTGHVVAVNTATSALHLAMLLAGVEPGDEVITPSFNNIADFQAIRAAGGEPVFCDIREDSLAIDVEKAQALVSPKTKAIIGTDYAGVPCELEGLADLARRHGIKFIHDASHSIGSRHRGRPIGDIGDYVIFSFDPVKVITCIDGGAILVRSSEEVARLHRYRLLGMDQAASQMYTNNRAWTYDVATEGFRYHLANLHAAIGLTQLKRLDDFVTTRQWACREYNRLLKGAEWITIPQTDWVDAAPMLYYVRVHGGRRDGLISGLKARGIGTGIHWIPGHRFSFFKNCRHGDLSVTNRVGDEIVTLPLHSYMTADTVHAVVDGIQQALQQRRAA